MSPTPQLINHITIRPLLLWDKLRVGHFSYLPINSEKNMISIFNLSVILYSFLEAIINLYESTSPSKYKIEETIIQVEKTSAPNFLERSSSAE